MDLLKIVGGILSAMYDSAGSTYNHLSHDSRLSDEQRDTCRSYARDMKERRNYAKNGDFGSLFSSSYDDDD